MEQGIHPGLPVSFEPATELPVHLSLVIPAYNEETRLAPTLEAVLAYLSAKPYRSEALVVLDGCTDGTAEVARRFVGTHGPCELRLLDNAENRGKGACVRQGMLAAHGAYRFFTDADLSYPLHQIDRFLETLVLEGGIAIASRDASSVRYQRPLRRLITWLSRRVMSLAVVPGIKDTQAGLKGFTQAAALDLFARQRIDRFGFDAEVLHLAHWRGYPIRPMPVEWTDVPGSKVSVMRDVTRMGLDLGRVMLNRLLGRYRHPHTP